MHLRSTGIHLRVECDDAVVLTLGSDPLRWSDLGLRPGLDLGPFTVRFYALAYIAGILLGYWHLRRMARESGSPLGREQVDDLVVWATLGIVIGGRVGYATFYDLDLWRTGEVVQIWHGGMSFHGGLLGVLAAIVGFSWRHRLPLVRIGDYVAVNVPFGMMFGRIANFINGELWGKPSDAPWAMVFPGAGDQPRHPSQLYEAALEGGLLIVVMLWLFWRTHARWRPGLLGGAFLVGIGAARFVVEFFREPDAQLADFAERTGLHMGQWLTIPLVVAGVVLVARGLRRPAVAVVEPAGSGATGPPSTE